MRTVSEESIQAIFGIVHLYRDFELYNYIDLKEFIPEPYPEIGIDKLDAKVRRYLQYKKPTEYDRNQYVL